MPGDQRDTSKAFKPAWWLRSPHLQTLWPSLLRLTRAPALRRERFELPDGDFLELDWTCNVDSGPLVVLLHGLEGSSRSPYMRGMLRATVDRGWQGVAMHFRGCGGTANRLARTYHSGDTGDLDAVLTELKTHSPERPIALVGYSLGGNVLLKWLAEARERAGVKAAVAISVPLVLAEAAKRLERGFSTLYQRWLIAHLKRKLRAKFAQRTCPFDLDALDQWNTFRLFDHHVTAALHGFRDVNHYYDDASARQYLSAIRTPTLIVQANDDPFMTSAVVPTTHELSSSTKLELTEGGGHVGFVAGQVPFWPRYWLEQRIPAFIGPHLTR